MVVIITICILLLFAYVFDITSGKTKIPSVILLLMMGWIVKLIISFFNIVVPDLNPILPIFGTLGLILIVFEGSLELELAKSKLGLIAKSAFIALISIVILSAGLGFVSLIILETSIIRPGCQMPFLLPLSAVQ